MAFSPGTHFGRYHIQSLLGAGGMGEVYLAEDTRLGRRVAIKFLPADLVTDERARKRMTREARAAATLDHPNICSIYEVGEAEDHSFIVMQFVEGETLDARIKRQPLSLTETLKVAEQIADALAEAHAHGVVHRDIKPQNIIVSPRGRVKVLDFGLAKVIPKRETKDLSLTETDFMTAPGAIVGTLPYMSPEQLRSEMVDERTDVFSYGIVLYEMLTGRHPFFGANEYEVAAAILKEETIRESELPPSLPRSACAFLLRLLEKDKHRRYQSFEEIKDEIDALKREAAVNASAGEMADTRVHFQLPQSARLGTASAQSPFARQSVAPKSVSTTPTILVLPLEAVGSQPETTFIGLGLAYAITTDLAKIEGLSVLSKTASTRTEQSHNGRELARELGASLLLEGEVMRSGRKIRIMARLIDAETGRVIWGGQQSGDEDDLFTIQDAVCGSVASALKVNISSSVREQMARPAAVNIDAFELYSRGRAFLERREVKENIDFALQMFEEALRLDPHFALAQAGIAEAYWRKFEVTREKSWVSRAVSASDRALVLDPHQAQVHISLGMVYHGTGKIEAAIEEFESAIKLQPLSDDAHRWLARCFMQEGETERAINFFKRAIEIRPGYWDNYNWLGTCYYTLGRYSEAAEQYRRVITIQPDNYQGYNNLGAMYYFLGQYEDAVRMLERANEIHPSAPSYNNLGSNLFYLGRYEEAIEAYKSAMRIDPKDDILYRNLGDAYLHFGKEKEARAQYEEGLRLLREALSVKPDNATLLSRAAVCEAKLGLAREAHLSIESAAAIEPHNTKVMYQRAVIEALLGETDAALKSLGHALSNGYSPAEAERDPDLYTLRGRAEFRSLFAAAN